MEAPRPERIDLQVDATTHARHASIMALGTALSRLTGFLRYAGLAYVLGLTLKYGRTNLPSTYNLANSMPNMIFDLVIGGIIASLFIPVFVEYLTTKSRDEAYHVANLVTTISVILLTLVTAVGIILSPLIIRLMTLFGSYSAADTSTAIVRQQATFLLRFFIPQVIFYGLSAIFTGLLNSHGHFTVPAFAPIFNNLVVILTVIIYSLLPVPRDNYLHIVVLACGTTLGVVAQALVQIPALRKLGLRLRFTFDMRHPALQKIGRLSLPLFGYILLWQVSTWFVFALAIQEDGGVPSYQYAQMFLQLPYGVLAVSIITALFPTLSEQAAASSRERFRNTLSAGISSTLVVIMPCAVIYLMLNRQIITLLLQHGFFKAGDTVLLSQVLFFFALGLVPYSVDMLLTKAFYSMQDTKTPMIINCFVVGVNITANYFLFKALGVKGLALGFTVSYLFAMSVDGSVLRARIKRIGGLVILNTFIRAALASAAMALVIYASTYLLEGVYTQTSLIIDLLKLILPFSLGGITYILAANALKIGELKILGAMISRYLPLAKARGE